MSKEQNKESPPSTDDNHQQGSPLNNPSTEKPIIPAAETIAEAEQLSTLNLSAEASAKADPQPLNPDMEVHHHSHPSTSPGHRKKWTHYFWEFLMLFLAVFCGFMAENIREHKIEQHRARDFSKSLVQDLQNDTAAINTEKNTAKVYIAVTDSLLELSKGLLEGRQAAKFSFYTRFTYWTVPISWNRNTYEQIKNSGSLRYFKNGLLLKKLLEYDALVNDVKAEEIANAARGNMLLPLINSTIEPALHYEFSKYFLASLDTMSNETKEILFSYKTGRLENKREKISEFLNMVVVQQRNFQNQINTRWKKAQLLATELINDIKKEYHLK